MGDLVNLRQARKRRERAAREREAQENRTRFGLGRPEKAKAGSERARLLATLDGARLTRGKTPDPSSDEPDA